MTTVRWPRATHATALSVLIVDDNRDAADSLAELLRLYGHGVRVAYCPEDALAEDPPDVLILEVRLPGVDGWELVRQMRERATAKQPFYIAATTRGSKADRRRSEEAGIDLHLVKPIDPAVLVGVLNRFARVLG
jgi:two-component system, OmpR family, response regulator